MSERLRIALVAPIASPVHELSKGSIEQLVWLQAEELVRLGHDVTLFATGDSRTSAKLRSVYPRGYDNDDDLWNYEFHEIAHAAAAFEQARAFDIIHSHVYHYALPFTRLVRTPTVHSYHILPDDDIALAYARYPEAHVVALSAYQRRFFNGHAVMAVVHHGIDTDAFPFNPAGGDYLVFLGAINAGKGAAEAIQLARQAGLRLVMAGPRQDEDGGYFETEIAPWLDGRQVEYLGPVSPPERNPLLAGARALLYPITSPEPFGLVLIEAMACGTPVLATDLGAVPEIVEHGRTGFYQRDWQRLARFLPEVGALDRVCIRQRTVQRFDYRRMVADYVTLYRRLTNGRRR
jgi:glycosyltransferase involved in cell wall biosynthesis